MKLNLSDAFSYAFHIRNITIEINNKNFKFTLLYRDGCISVDVIDWELPDEYKHKLIEFVEIIKNNCSFDGYFTCNEQNILSDFKRILMPELDKKLLNKKALIAVFNDIYTENGGGEVLLLTKENYERRGFEIEDFYKIVQAKKGEEIQIDNYRFVVLDILD